MVPKEVDKDLGPVDASKVLAEWDWEWDPTTYINGGDQYLTTSYQGIGYTVDEAQLMKWGTSAPVKTYESSIDWFSLQSNTNPPKPKPHQCPICLKQRHSAPLTRNLHDALVSHRLEDYDWRNDESEILCPWPGEGPVRDFNQRGYYQPSYGAPWVLPKFEFDPTPWEKLLEVWGTTATKVGPTKDPETQIDVEYKAIEKPKIQPKELEAAKETLTDVEWDGGIELPDMKADYDSLAETVNKKTYHYVIKEKK